MQFQQTLSTIESSAIFKQFKKKFPKAELVAGFFILDLLNNNNQKSLDYKSDSKIFTFQLDINNEITMKQDKLIQYSKFPPLQKISPNIKLDLNELPSIAQKQAEENNIKNKFEKIIAVLQIYEERQIWNLTCILDGFVILNILIDSNNSEIIKFERKSIADFVKKV